MTTHNAESEELFKLVAAAQLGDREAWGRVAMEATPSIYATALARLKNAHDAQDLTQAVLVHGFRKIRQLRDPRCIMGWLRRIAKRMTVDWQTKDPLLLPFDTNEHEPLVIDPNRSPLDQLVLREDCTILYLALARLKALYRETLWRFYMQGQSVKRIAFEMETNDASVKRRLHYGRAKLGRQLLSMGFAYSLTA